MLGNLLAAFMVILVGISIFPTVAQEIDTITYNISYSSNVTSTDDASTVLLSLVPIIFVLIIGLTVLALLSSSFKEIGTFAESDDEYDDEYEEDEEDESTEKPKAKRVEVKDTPKTTTVNTQDTIVVRPQFDEKYFTRGKYA